MIKYRYTAQEKFRIQSINRIKEEREKIIEEANDIKLGKDNTDANRITYTNMSKTHMTTTSKEKWGGTNTTAGDEVDLKMEKIFSDQKKAMMKIKQKQRQDIQALIKSQIERELSEKINFEKERRHREKEEENNRELERKKKFERKKIKRKRKKKNRRIE